VEPFVKRMVSDHLLQLGNQLRVFTACQPRLYQGALDLPAQQAEPVRLLFEPGDAGDVRQRRAAPQRERLAQVRSRAAGSASGSARRSSRSASRYVGTFVARSST